MDELIAERLGREDAARGLRPRRFPRTLEQVAALDRVLGRLGVTLDRVFVLGARGSTSSSGGCRAGESVPDAAGLYHLESRPPAAPGVCDGCGSALVQRQDDQEDVVRHRLAVYTEQTMPVLVAYRDRGLLQSTWTERRSGRGVRVRVKKGLDGRVSRMVLKSPAEIEIMDRANRIVRSILAELRTMVRPGVTTLEIDRRAEERHPARREGRPAFKGYPHPSGGREFPGTVCASVNDEVVHGIPSTGVTLREGDIVSVDLGVLYRGYFGDAAMTVAVGAVAPAATRLLEVTREALRIGVQEARPGNRVSDIGHQRRNPLHRGSCAAPATETRYSVMKTNQAATRRPSRSSRSRCRRPHHR